MRVSIGRSKKIYQCAHVIIREWDDGIDVELFEVIGRRSGSTLIIEMPQDGRVVKVMNDNGDVIRKLEWKD